MDEPGRFNGDCEWMNGRDKGNLAGWFKVMKLSPMRGDGSFESVGRVWC